MSKVSVIGLGNWGTALANHLAAKGHDVLGWTNEPDIVLGINTAHRNPRYQSDALLETTLRATGDLAEAGTANILVLAIPSSALKDVIPKLRLTRGTTVISGIKGLDAETLQTPLQFVAERGGGEADLAVLSGPSFAADLIAKRPVGVVAAARNEEIARRVAELFNSDWMRVYLSGDPLGVELGGVFKNVIALAAGVSDGLGFGESALAGLITRGLAEMMRLAEAMGAERQTLFGLSGLGDLAMTATCNTSRNRTVGLRLGRGETLKQIVATIGSVAEGVSSTPLILELGLRHGVDLPIAEAVARLLSGEVTAKEMARSLIQRPIKREF